VIFNESEMIMLIALLELWGIYIFILNPVIKKSVNSRGEISLFPDFPQNYRGQSSNP